MSADSKLEELSSKITECVVKHDQVVHKLLELADELDKEEREMDIAKIAFASSGTIGGGLAILGFGLSFVTFGASLILTAVGAGISAVSSAGDIATSVAEKIVENEKVKEAKEAVESYSTSIKSFSPILESFCDVLPGPDQEKVWKSLKDDVEIAVKIKGIVSNVSKFVQTISSIKKLMAAARNVQDVVQAAEGDGEAVAGAVNVGADVVQGGDDAFRALGAGAKAIKIGGVALTGLGVVIDVGSIVYYGIKVHKRKPSEVAELIRKLANALST